MRQRAKQSGRWRRGFTLLEVLVATAVGAVIFALALGILLSTNSMANRGLGHESVVQQAQLAMQELRSVLEATVWPEDLATSPAAGALVFAKDSLALFSSHEPTTGGLFCLYKFQNAKRTAEKKSGTPLAAGFDRVDPATMKPLGSFREFGREFETALSFRYATQAGADLQPVWQESLPAGQKPRLIWVELIMTNRDIRDHRDRPEVVRLVTAVSL